MYIGHWLDQVVVVHAYLSTTHALGVYSCNYSLPPTLHRNLQYNNYIRFHLNTYIYIYIYSTTGTSCNWRQPPPLQVECLHQLKEGKHHKHKVQRSGFKMQRSGHKVQRLGPASVLVSTGCSKTCNYNHHHHHQRCRYDQHSRMQQSLQLE